VIQIEAPDPCCTRVDHHERVADGAPKPLCLISLRIVRGALDLRRAASSESRAAGVPLSGRFEALSGF